MSKRLFLWITVALAACVAVAGLWSYIAGKRDQAELADQLRQAAAEGIPTDSAQYAAAIKPASADQNAAPYYKRLGTLVRGLPDIQKLDIALMREPTDAHAAEAEKALAQAKPALDLIDQATKLPRCWFDRKWSQGAAVLMPELATMKQSARLLALRGSVAAYRGRTQEALAAHRDINIIGRHCNEELSAIAALVAESIRTIALHSLANWAFVRPNVPAYRSALTDAVQHMPKPDLRMEFRGELLDVLSIIDLCQTPEGRKNLGLRDEDIPKGPNPFAIFLSQTRSKIAIVKAARDAYAALKLAPDQMAAAREDADQRRDLAMLAFPIADKIYSQLSSGSDPGDIALARIQGAESTRVMYTALLRAYSAIPAAKSIKVDDLLSPADHSPLTYTFDGRQITITLSTPNPASQRKKLSVPPVPL